MKKISTSIFAGAMLLAASMSFAEESHHPAEEAAPQPPVQQQGMQGGTPGGTMPGGMMSGGMMSGDMMQMMMRMMMGQGGASPMMGMGRMNQMGPGGGPMGQMMSPEHIEGRIAFLETELKVTETQRPLWNALAEALRTNARGMDDMRPGMQGGAMSMQGSGMGMQDGMMTGAADVTPVERVEQQERALAARLEALRQIRTALAPFYASLDEAQKEKADKLLVPAPMGMM